MKKKKKKEARECEETGRECLEGGRARILMGKRQDDLVTIWECEMEHHGGRAGTSERGRRK